MRGTGRVAFAAVLLLVVGVINIIYGIGALDDANVVHGIFVCGDDEALSRA